MSLQVIAEERIGTARRRAFYEAKAAEDAAFAGAQAALRGMGAVDDGDR